MGVEEEEEEREEREGEDRMERGREKQCGNERWLRGGLREAKRKGKEKLAKKKSEIKQGFQAEEDFKQ